ncbi:RNA polymerase sigma factor [Myxococcus llanfairpwllgwyngyllgogerychwyrndrobwllllantysiliogogogochensis]|uniref:RNA polymerase sigma factor n=1 Tax=Myxococcus llanfairpwllgwyngyllgogerychwyrndrobwllllantysiliogogogochensis TaxID=2590453 RepID=A0A540WM77_9BACT|nr:RNA polymerase sigma factor [Myxococcus llanfairpwllgwyngyllgogerychwyrndrobwllllantysiliogogogochensis]TQF10122.1 RNA polymerase sigma factor [Myxococcus llanfairpwllgwyngyllgogerychwyrndrobwllllantysiliogogogochensis]
MRDGVPDEARRWLSLFHAGDRPVLNACYREHFDTVYRAATRVLPAVDAETVVHDVFLRLMSDEFARRSFKGGSLSAWLHTLSRNLAVDRVRRRQREGAALAQLAAEPRDVEPPAPPELELDADLLVERFRRERLPAKWAPVFEARFVRHLSQRDAATALGMHRTTLAYQELRVRRLLEKFLLTPEAR